ncbi:sugar transferase [Lentibacillus halodurans]|nr:sugar transferase [Lentibacillus halodurans]
MIKRSLDIAISLVCLLVLTPFMVWIACRMMKKEGKPIFFRQARVGREHRIFVLWRFRTKTNSSKVIRSLPPHPFPKNWDNGVPDAFYFKRDTTQTVTQTGNWLKKYHLDRIPELFNVLKGDMSLVGPSPEVPEIADHYNQYQAQRLRVKPGIICLSQINGYTNQNYGKKIRDDLFYIRNCSVKWDMVIICRALKQRMK